MTPQERIASFAELKQNWDSYGARAIDPAQMRLALRFIDALSQAQPVPTTSGGVGFEVDVGDATLHFETKSATVFELTVFGDSIDESTFKANDEGV